MAAQQQQAWIGERLLQPGDIAILVRTGTEATLVRRALRRLGIGSVYLSNRDSVLASQEAHDLLRILEACLAPGDEVRVRSAMATALLGWSANQLAALNADELQWEAIVEQFREGAVRWQRQGVLPMIRHFLFSHQIPARLLIEEEGERRLTDALHVAELLQQAAATLPGEHALLRWLRDQLAAPDGNADEQKLRLESERRLVQVVTIHKSKGLEYPLVLLPFIADWRPSQLARYHEGNRVVWDLFNTEAALAQADGLPAVLAAEALGVDGAQWPSLRSRLGSERWWHPQGAAASAQGQTVGGFTGLGGPFAAPPELRASSEGFISNNDLPSINRSPLISPG